MAITTGKMIIQPQYASDMKFTLDNDQKVVKIRSKVAENLHGQDLMDRWAYIRKDRHTGDYMIPLHRA